MAFWHCDSCCAADGCTNPNEFTFCPHCGRARTDGLPNVGDQVWVKATVKEHVAPIPGGLIREDGFFTRERCGLYLPKDYGESWMRVGATTADYEEYERRIANQAKLLGERTKERDVFKQQAAVECEGRQEAEQERDEARARRALSPAVREATLERLLHDKQADFDRVVRERDDLDRLAASQRAVLDRLSDPATALMEAIRALKEWKESL